MYYYVLFTVKKMFGHALMEIFNQKLKELF